jgi:hypothetical protein
VILVRTQVGWLPEHPIRIHCAKCGILISGGCIQDQEDIEFNMYFENAKELNYENVKTIDFYIEISGELLTLKIRSFDKKQDEYQVPPFFNTLWSMDDENHETFSRFKENVLQFLYFIRHDWPFVRRLHELWIAGRTEYLAEQMKEYLPEKIFPLNNNLEYLRGIHQLFLRGFHPVIHKEFYDSVTKTIWENISFVSKHYRNEFIKLTEYFNDKGLFREYENRIYGILNSFVDKYQFFITAIGLDNYKEQPNLLKYGTTTVSFDDIKHFYLDCFEAIGEIISIIIAYNNLKYRNSHMIMAESSFTKIKDLNDYLKMQNKGHKIKFCENNEIFNSILVLESDNGLRNAIGHGSYTYDGVNQIISYYSSGKNQKGELDQIYLVDFIKKEWKMLQTVINLNELLYQTRKFYYVLHGIVPISLEVFEKGKKTKIGRNDLCSCGSGKKYKKCCGRKI